MSADRVRFGRLHLARVSPKEARAWTEAAATGERASVVVTSNIHHLRLAERDPVFRDVLDRSDLNVVDGWPIVMGLRLVGTPVLGRVAGIDLVDDILSTSQRLRVAILGGPPGAAEALAARVAPRHDVVLVEPLQRGSWDTPAGRAAVRAALVSARPNLVLIGIGPPRQELLADELRDAVAGPIVCCGAAIEVLAGLRPRAPRWVQRSGLEWLFRLALEPRRLAGRYAAGAFVFTRVTFRELGARLRGRSGSGGSAGPQAQPRSRASAGRQAQPTSRAGGER